MNISDYIVPLLFAGVLIYGLCTKTDVFGEFTEGVKEGLHTVYEIFPSLFCLVVTVGVFRASGGAELITDLISPVLNAAGFPPECGTLLILRPFSGSGSTAIFEQLLTDFGADSFAGRTASVILGSSETTFYTLSVYFAAVKAGKTRYALAAALIGDITCAVISPLAVRLFLT
ncbi:MAG: spore maturation protein [Ruminiclostridium sp.]|nr:spore maturation protein [Ruminiclostridium sp.]